MGVGRAGLLVTDRAMHQDPLSGHVSIEALGEGLRGVQREVLPVSQVNLSGCDLCRAEMFTSGLLSKLR